MKSGEKREPSEIKLFKKEEIILANIKELERRKKEGEIDPTDYDLNNLYYLIRDGLPVRLSDVKNDDYPKGQAINITQEVLEVLEDLTGNSLHIILASGEIIEIASELTGYKKGDRLIIFPEELGEVPKTIENPL